MAQDSPAEFAILAPTPRLSLHAKASQIDGIQILRAIAVFLVAWLHAGQQLDKWRVKELPHFAAFGIDIFFVISGFIMSLVLLRTKQGPGIQATWGFLKRQTYPHLSDLLGIRDLGDSQVATQSQLFPAQLLPQLPFAPRPLPALPAGRRLLMDDDL